MTQPKALRINVLEKTDGWWLFGLQVIETDEPVNFRAITVPKGYVCNLGSIPFGFRWLIRPFYWRSMPCYIVHDYLCDHAETYETRKLADQTLKEHLKERGFRWRPYAVYLAVRLYANFYYIFKNFNSKTVVAGDPPED